MKYEKSVFFEQVMRRGRPGALVDAQGMPGGRYAWGTPGGRLGDAQGTPWARPGGRTKAAVMSPPA